ncbi:MAG: hypothetical protein P4M09_31980 [Devosia sp.]|nr:hypothetical protein [Devosia sp.]
MLTHSHFVFRPIRAACAVAAFVAGAALAAVLVAAPAAAQQAIYAPGEPIVTGFSGVVPPDKPPASGDPLDATFIDLAGNSMVIQQLQPDGPPTGQLIPSPPVFTAKAKDVGQVFGIALDNAPDISGAAAPNIYLAATSAFGLDIVVPDASGNPLRSKLGAAGASFMPGLWGAAGGAVGSPGSIWKVDGTTGQISLFTTIAANTGPGLGNIVFDAATQQFFVSDLDTGLIYRLASDGTILDTFDHGVNGRPNHGLAAAPDDGSAMDVTNPAFNSEDPSTWGFTQPERKVYGLAMHGGRLYYSVAAGPQIWSVGVNLDGTFAGDARWELDVTGLPSSNEITNIVFDPEGRMILAQRGPQVDSYDYSVFAEPKTSQVIRYTHEVPDDPSTPSTWVETPDSYAIGFRPDGNNASGGIALGYGYDPGTQSIGGACSTYLWSTGDSLRDDPAMSPPLVPPAQVHGLQGNDRSLVRPQNDPPTNSYFTDYDGNTGDDQAQNQGHVGDVEIWQKCEGGYGYAPPPYFPPPGYVPPPGGNLTLIKKARPQVCIGTAADWLCGFTIRVKNTGPTTYWGPLTVDDWLPDNNPGAHMFFGPQPPWSCSQLGSTEYECGYPPVVLYPGDSVDLFEVVKLPKAGNTYCYLNNAASLEWLYGYHDGNPGDDQDFASAKIPDPNCKPPEGPKTNLELKKIAHPQTCLQGFAGWDCSFFIKVTNTGPGDYNAPIQIKDTLPFATPTSYAPGPPWSCVPAGPTLTCDHPAVLLHPGNFVLLKITATIPFALAKDKQVCKFDNVARITQAPGGTDLNTNPADDLDHATALIPSDDCNPNRPRTDLSLTKTAMGCAEQPARIATNAVPAGIVCAFEIRVKNEGPANFNGNVVVHDAFTPAIPPAFFLSAPAGICGPAGGGYDCTLAGLNLLPGQSHPFFVGFRLPANAQVCDVRNLARITSPAGGSILNFNPANDQGSASVHIPSANCNPAGRTDLSLTKTEADCTLRILLQAGEAVACFDVAVKDEGPANYNGPITFLDHTSVPALSVIGGSDATCTAVGADHTCTSTANAALTPGATVTYHVAVVFSTQNGEVCQIGNRARLTAPAGGSPLNFNPANDTGAATVSVSTGDCAPHPVSPAAQCPTAQKMPGGDCCPDGSTWNGRACSTPGQHKPPIIRVCPDDSHGTWPNCVCDSGTHGTPGKCVPDQTTPQCPRDSHWSGRTCQCNAPLIGKPGNCQPPVVTHQCPTDSRWNGRTCQCNPGTTGDPGHCVGRIPTNPIPLCPSDSHWNVRSHSCVCNQGTGKPGSCLSRTIPKLQLNPGVLQFNNAPQQQIR